VTFNSFLQVQIENLFEFQKKAYFVQKQSYVLSTYSESEFFLSFLPFSLALPLPFPLTTSTSDSEVSFFFLLTLDDFPPFFLEDPKMAP